VLSLVFVCPLIAACASGSKDEPKPKPVRELQAGAAKVSGRGQDDGRHPVGKGMSQPTQTTGTITARPASVVSP